MTIEWIDALGVKYAINGDVKTYGCTASTDYQWTYNSTSRYVNVPSSIIFTLNPPIASYEDPDKLDGIMPENPAKMLSDDC